jgi:hypothetical protein
MNDMNEMNDDEADMDLLFPDAAGDDEAGDDEAGDDELDVAIENLILQIAMWLEGNEEEDEDER